MTKSLRATFIAAIVVLAAGWLGLRSQNSQLETEISEASKAPAAEPPAPAEAPTPAEEGTP